MWGFLFVLLSGTSLLFSVKLDILEILEEYEKAFPELNYNLDVDVSAIYKPETITPEWQWMACLATVSQIQSS